MECKEKFKYDDEVIVENLVINDRLYPYITGRVVRYHKGGLYVGKVVVRINAVELFYDEDKVFHYKDYVIKEK